MTATDVRATARGSGPGVRFSTWRHGAPVVRAMPGVHLGEGVLGPDVVDEARRVHESGARFVSIEREVDLGGRPGSENVIPALSFIRELTSYGLEVDWRARVAPDGPEWWVFGHLFPPAELAGPRGPEALAVWRARYHVGRCFLRRGPGFVQIRDRRHAGLRRLTVSDGPTLSAMESLLADRGAGSLPDRTRSVFEQQRLLVRIGGDVWWAPYRLRRWAVPSWEV